LILQGGGLKRLVDLIKSDAKSLDLSRVSVVPPLKSLSELVGYAEPR
jgi:hypothetical protein